MYFDPADFPGVACLLKHYNLKLLTLIHTFGLSILLLFLSALVFFILTVVKTIYRGFVHFLPLLVCSVVIWNAVTTFYHHNNYLHSELISKSPNILWIIVDDLNTASSFAGIETDSVLTPNLNSLVKESISFDNVFAHVPKCAPSRSSFLLNRSVRQSHLRDDCSCKSWKYFVGDDVVPLPHQIKRHGYSTIGVGKISHQKLGNHRWEGWDTYYPSLDLAWYDEVDAASIDDETCLPQCLPDPAVSEPVYAPQTIDTEPTFRYGTWKFNTSLPDDLLIDWSVKFLSTEPELERPFFLTVGLKKPHLPLFLHKIDVDRALELSKYLNLDRYIDGDLDDVGTIGKTKSNHFYWDLYDKNIRNESVVYYMAGKVYSDRNIGRLIESLKSTNLWDDTTLLVSSDNGFSLGEKGHFKKFVLWRESANVNLIIKPSVDLAKLLTRRSNCTLPSRISTAASLVDIHQTIVDIARGDVIDSDRLDVGRNLLSQCSHDSINDNNQYVLSANHLDTGYYALSGSKYRYISYDWNEVELYDNEADRGEVTNLASLPAYAGIKEKLKQALWDCLLSGDVHVELDQVSTMRTARLFIWSLGQLLTDGSVWVAAGCIALLWAVLVSIKQKLSTRQNNIVQQL